MSPTPVHHPSTADQNTKLPTLHLARSANGLFPSPKGQGNGFLAEELCPLISVLEAARKELEVSVSERNHLDTLMTEVNQAFRAVDLTSLAPLEIAPQQVKAIQVDPEVPGFSPFDLYDQYMRIARLCHISPQQFIRQSLETCALFALELAAAPISSSEINRALQGMTIILQDCGSLPAENPSPTPSQAGSSLSPQGPQSDCPATQAFHRWIVAHHGFALAMQYSNLHLEKALTHLHTFPAEAAREVELAADLLRMTTTATICGACMPPQIYQNVIRPSLSSTAMPRGFSGIHNPDFATWKSSKDKLRQLIKTGPEITHPDLKKAIRYFRDIYLEDMEQHIQVATSLVGQKPSLSQEKMGAYGNPKNQEPCGAAEILRKLLRVRHKEFNIGFLKQ